MVTTAGSPSLSRSQTNAGIDVPLGWPDAFVGALTAHAAGKEWTPVTMPRLLYRETDHYVRDTIGKIPLSVAADKIGVPALRAAALLARLEPGLDRSGGGKVVEVYPAAALRRWGFDPFEHDGRSLRLSYKGKKGEVVRGALVSRMRTQLSSWLEASEQDWQLCIESDDAFDALVASLVARAAALGLTDSIPNEGGDAARREGWILLPAEGSLGALPGN